MKVPGRNLPLKKLQGLELEKTVKSSLKVLQMETENLDSETKDTAHSVTGLPLKLWNPPPGLKFPCPLGNHKHEVIMCSEFFNLMLLDRWEKIKKARMYYSCLKPKTSCRERKCNDVGSVPKVLKCPICASCRSQRVWLHSASFSVNRNFMENQELSCRRLRRI